jgi:glycerol-3-phosphate dehydrogenase
LSVALLEAHDFAKGTSSRATKLLHGGVRYLAQGNIKLVYEALHERAVVLRNAPHLAERLAFVIPCYSRWRQLQYGVGLGAYAALAGRRSLGPTQWLGRAETIAALPSVRQQGLTGGIRYWDGQFDDARLALALARTALSQGALLLNYAPVLELLHRDGRVAGAVFQDRESGARIAVHADCVVNATGVWVDGTRRLDIPMGAPAEAAEAFQDRVRPSRGAHIVLDKSFLPSDQALMIPRTADGRVLFAIPWQGQLLAGTTDIPSDVPETDPIATPAEVEFILSELGAYLTRRPTLADVRSRWAGLRPLVRPEARRNSQSHGMATPSISREHDITVSPHGLVSVTGGKWTTYRVIAGDTLQACVAHGLLRLPATCSTADLPLWGAPPHSGAMADHGDGNTDVRYHAYGSDAAQVQQLPGADRWLTPTLNEAMVRYAARCEMARTVDDVLARRCRLLFTDAQAAIACAPRVAAVLQEEGVGAPQLDAFIGLAQRYAGGTVT